MHDYTRRGPCAHAGDLRVLSWQPFSNTSVSVWEERLRVLGRMRVYVVWWALGDDFDFLPPLKPSLTSFLTDEFCPLKKKKKAPCMRVEGEADECGVCEGDAISSTSC